MLKVAESLTFTKASGRRIVWGKKEGREWIKDKKRGMAIYCL
jgi:hypothetical protein